MKKIITVPVTSIELKTINKVGSAWNGRQYYLITFRTGGMMNARYRKTAVMLPHPTEQPEEYAMVKKYFDDQIVAKKFEPLQGSYFTVGDKSLDPNTITLPDYQSKRSDGTYGAVANSIEVFVLYNAEEDRYEISPQKKAMQIVTNPDLCRIVVRDDTAPSGPDPLNP